MKKNALRLYLNKDIRYNERPCTLKVTASLDDDCHNKHCDFSITCMVYLKNPRRNEDPCIAGGCDHELIGKYFPELRKFFPLHLCTHEGTPMYPVENGIYYINKSGLEVAKKYLRISDSEYLKLAKSTEDRITLLISSSLSALLIGGRKRLTNLSLTLKINVVTNGKTPTHPTLRRAV